MKKILYWLFGKPQYYYNPMLTKGEGENPMYMVTVCEYWRGQKKPIKPLLEGILSRSFPRPRDM